MKHSDDNRLWLDRAQGQEVFGLYEDQRFYSVQYTGGSEEEIRAFLSNVRDYEAWAREAFLAIRSGQEAPPFPEHLLQEQKPVEEDADYGEAEDE